MQTLTSTFEPSGQEGVFKPGEKQGVSYGGSQDSSPAHFALNNVTCLDFTGKAPISALQKREGSKVQNGHGTCRGHAAHDTGVRTWTQAAPRHQRPPGSVLVGYRALLRCIFQNHCFRRLLFPKISECKLISRNVCTSVCVAATYSGQG